MRNIISSMESEYRKYKQLAELAIGQLSDAELSKPPAPGANSIATLVWHLSGNLKSRFTDFLTIKLVGSRMPPLTGLRAD